MIQCENCETSQFLQITESRMWFDDGMVGKVTERYECTLCESSGGYHWTEDDGPELTGDVSRTVERPREVTA